MPYRTMSCHVTSCRTIFVLTAVLALAACAEPSSEQNAYQGVALDTSKMPPAGIFTVKDVVVTQKEGDTLELKAATTNKFTLAELDAVVSCRAREEAMSRKYDGWYQDAIQHYSNGPSNPQLAVATIKYFKGKAPEGKKTWRNDKNPCNEIPAVAKAKV